MAGLNCSSSQFYKPLISSTNSQVSRCLSWTNTRHACSFEKLQSECRRLSRLRAHGGAREVVPFLYFVEDTAPTMDEERTSDTGIFEGNEIPETIVPSPEQSQPDVGTPLSADTQPNELVPDVFSSTDPNSGTPDPGDLVNSASEAISAQKTQAVEAITKTIDATKNSVKQLQDNGENFITGIKDSVTSSINNAGSTLKHSYDDFNSSISKIAKGTGTSVDFTSAFRTGTPTNNNLKEVVIFVENGAGTVFAAVGQAVSGAYNSIKVLTPPGVQAALETTEKMIQQLTLPLSSVLGQATELIVRVERALGLDPENPVIPIFLFSGVSISLGILYWQSQYGGYSGDLSPETVIDLITKDRDILLVDIRSHELKQRDGVPDIRRRSRFKISSINPIQVVRPFRSLLRSADEVDVLLTATIIRNLKSVKKNTEVVVMDADGTKSKAVARALKKAGVRRPYRLNGGFTSWTASGLRRKSAPSGTETPFAVLKEDAEDIAEELKPTGIIALVLGTAIFGYALYEWEKTLQLIGIFAVLQAIYNRLDSYETVEDLQADIRLLQMPLKLAAQRAVKLTGRPKPAKLELATSPSTTAVQDRVIQAAAKHGPVSTETQVEKVDE